MANEIALLLRGRHGEADENALSDIGDIVATACLCHDLGNPPFGHSGEKTIATYFSEGEGLALRDSLTERQWSDVVNFEGNANSFRMLSHQFAGRRPGGFAMTYSTLASIVKYPHTSLHASGKGKFGFFESEDEIWRKVAADLGIPEREPGRFVRHPLVWIMEAADDICYQVMDIEDAHRLRILSTDEVKQLFLPFFDDEGAARRERGMTHLDDPSEKVGYLRASVIGAMVGSCARAFADNEKALLDGTATGSLISMMDPRLETAYKRCAEVAADRIYRARDVVDVEIAGNRILTYLLHTLMEAVLNPERNFSRLLLEQVPRQYEIHADSLYSRVQAVLDHVSGMTDVYALDLFRKLNGHSLPAV